MKILYGVQGTGQGHISRARAMADAFRNLDVEIDWLFSCLKCEQGYFHICTHHFPFILHKLNFVRNNSENCHFFPNVLVFFILSIDHSAKTSLNTGIFQMLIVFSMQNAVDVQFFFFNLG